MSRPEISQHIGLNVVTVSNYIDSFLKERLVFEKTLDVSEGGRRPVLLDLNPDAAYAVGVGINLFNSVAVLVDLKGNIVARAKTEEVPLSAQAAADCSINLIRELLLKAKSYADKIKGLGIGIAGLVDKKSGSVHWPQRNGGGYNYVGLNINLRDALEKEFDLPVFVENDSTCACFAEQWARKDLSCKNAMFMFSGVGCGIMIKGDIYTGSGGFAGEISVHNPSAAKKSPCVFAESCLIERWEADLGIVEEARKMVQERESRLVEFCQGDINNLSLRSVFQAAKAKDALACELIEQGAIRLGIKTAFLVNLLNPDMVIIGGGFEEAGELFLTKLRFAVNEWAFKEMTADLKIVYSDLAENAVAVGAASLIVRRVFAQ